MCRVDQKETHYQFPYFLKLTKAEVQSLKLTNVDQNLKDYEVNEFDSLLCLRKYEGLKGYYPLKLISPVQQQTEIAKMLVKKKSCKRKASSKPDRRKAKVSKPTKSKRQIKKNIKFING